MEGEELTVPYFHDLFDDVEARQAYCEAFEFTCKCDRCRFEESLQPQLSKMRDVYPEVLNSVMARIHAKGQKRKRSFGKEFSCSVDEVEALIQSLGTTLLPRQQNWIRARFIANYVSKMYSDLLLDSPSKVASLRVLIDAIISVGMTQVVLGLAANLLWSVELSYSEDDPFHTSTLDRVLGIYSAYYGKQPKMALYNLIKSRIPPQFELDNKKWGDV
ncbi:unnamed protein product [Calypogeia fissa]